ncbi:MAG: hypothetical protein M3Y04_03490 [Actinomycetota bacterium]|nr:hypothetical protein [Actinomycetota bacterium]
MNPRSLLERLAHGQLSDVLSIGPVDRLSFLVDQSATFMIAGDWPCSHDSLLPSRPCRRDGIR